MIEIGVWLLTMFACGIAMIRSKQYGAVSSGITYITVGASALLGLYLKYDTQTFADILVFLKEWWILEMFIFLNIVTGYSFYARSRRSN